MFMLNLLEITSVFRIAATFATRD